MTALEVVATVLLPDHLREAVLGDLREEMAESGSSAGLRRATALVGIGLQVQVAPYRQSGARRAALVLLGMGVALIWAVYLSAWPPGFPAHEYDPVSRLALEFWGAPHLVGALGAGLLVGRLDPAPGQGDLVRWHVVLALAVLLAALPASSAWERAVAVTVVLGAARVARTAGAAATQVSPPRPGSPR